MHAPDYVVLMARFFPASMAHLGEAVARDQGKAHFIDGAMPGETIEGNIVLDKGSWARVQLTRIIDPSPERIDPVCPHFVRCGGCQWQFAAYEAQLRWKSEVLSGQLRHLGGIDSPVVRATKTVSPPYQYRNRMDFDVVDGRPALHKRRSNHQEKLEECHLLLPGLADLFEELGHLGSAQKVTIRMSIATGERHMIFEGGRPPPADRWDAAVSHRSHSGTQIISGNGAISEHVGTTRFRITGKSFFQNNTTGANALVDLVKEALQPQPGDTLLDGYAGGGLFAATVTPDEGRVIAIERSLVSVRDLRHNLAQSTIEDFRVILGSVEEAIENLDEYVQIAVVDPPRNGMGEKGVTAITATQPRALAYVSCDPASLARDTRYLAQAGYEMEWAAPVDLFPQTFHVETVASFIRSRT